MKTKQLLVFIFCISVYAGTVAQTAEEVRKFYESKAFDSVIVTGKKVIESKHEEFDTYLLVGRAHNGKLKYAEAIPFLEKAKSLTNGPKWVTAWALCELGIAYYATGEKKLSAENFSSCIRLNATKNSSNTALRYQWMLGLDPFYDSWTRTETENFIFHFQDTNAAFQRTFAAVHQSAFDSLHQIFKGNFARKIDFFVWQNDSDEMAKSMLKPLAFSRPEFYPTQSSKSHSLGHEIMHHLLSHAFPDGHNKFIVEGTCVYFDFSKKDNLDKLKKQNNAGEIKITEIWKQPNEVPDSILYPLGGELIKRIYTTYGGEKFLSFMKTQSLENAVAIFGPGINDLISQLEKDLKP